MGPNTYTNESHFWFFTPERHGTSSFDQGLFANFREVLFPMEAAACFDLVWGMLLENYRIKEHDEKEVFNLWKVFFTKEKHSRKLMQSSYCWWFRNPANQFVCSLSHYLQGFIHPRWLGMGFLPSTVSTLTLGFQHFGPCKLAACKPMSNLQGLQSRRGGCYIPPVKSRKSKHLLLKKSWFQDYFPFLGYIVNSTSRAAFFNIICWGAVYPWVQCLR